MIFCVLSYVALLVGTLTKLPTTTENITRQKTTTANMNDGASMRFCWAMGVVLVVVFSSFDHASSFFRVVASSSSSFDDDVNDDDANIVSRVL